MKKEINVYKIINNVWRPCCENAKLLSNELRKDKLSPDFSNGDLKKIEERGFTINVLQLQNIREGMRK